MNIGREYRTDWHDMMIEVSGPIIGWMQRTFAQTWAHNGWLGDLGEIVARFRTGREAAEKIPVPPGAFPVRPLRGSAMHSDLRNARFAAVRAARHSIWIENAYITDSRFISEIIKARHRGVDVRVIMPRENDSPLIKASNRALVSELVRHGVRVWLLPEMTHVKAAIIDGWACIGSGNYDRLSFHVNHEFDICYSDPAAVAVLRRDVFLRDMERGTEARDVAQGSPAEEFTDSLLQLFAGQF
jgi:cardiolipin synthase